MEGKFERDFLLSCDKSDKNIPSTVKKEIGVMNAIFR